MVYLVLKQEKVFLKIQIRTSGFVDTVQLQGTIIISYRRLLSHLILHYTCFNTMMYSDYNLIYLTITLQRFNFHAHFSRYLVSIIDVTICVCTTTTATVWSMFSDRLCHVYISWPSSIP